MLKTIIAHAECVMIAIFAMLLNQIDMGWIGDFFKP